MATVFTQYQGQLRTEAEHLKSQTKIITDAPTDNHGKGETFSPTDLVATALTSCMMTLMGIRANKEGIELGNIEAETTKVMQSNPRKISKIKVDFTIERNSLTEKEIEILKDAALNCPVALSIDPAIKQEISFQFS